jgi:MFS family permease
VTSPPEDLAAGTADVRVEPDPSQALRANRDFQVVLGGQAVSAFGDAVSLTAMPLLVLLLTGSGALMGLVAALQLLPDLVLGLPAGAFADRWDRRRMMMWADAGRAILTATIPVSYWVGLPTMAVILIVTVPINSLRVFWAAGFTSVVPNLVGREQLGRAYGYLEATASGGFIVGPALAGVLAATIGPASTLAIDAGSFFVSAASLSLVRRPLRAERSGEVPHIIADIKEGIRFVLRHEVLRSIIAYWGTMSIATAAFLPALAYYIKVDRHLGSALFGFVGSAWSVGYLAGSLLTGRLGRERVGLRMVAGSIVIGSCLVVIAATALQLVQLASAFVLGGALGILFVSYMTLRTAATPDELLGRVGSTARTITLGLQPLGLLAGGALIDAANGGTALMTMGVVAIAASVLFAFSRTFREAAH